MRTQLRLLLGAASAALAAACPCPDWNPSDCDFCGLSWTDAGCVARPSSPPDVGPWVDSGHFTWGGDVGPPLGDSGHDWPYHGRFLCVVTDATGACGLYFADGGAVPASPAGWCGDQPIPAGCSCGLDNLGEPALRCTGACMPAPDGGPWNCFLTNCGLVNCVAGAVCLTPNHCGK